MFEAIVIILALVILGSSLYLLMSSSGQLNAEGQATQAKLQETLADEAPKKKRGRPRKHPIA